MTNIERFKLMSSDELANYIYTHDDDLNDIICKSQGDCPFGDNVESHNCKECIKHWLESEVIPNEQM